MLKEASASLSKKSSASSIEVSFLIAHLRRRGFADDRENRAFDRPHDGFVGDFLAFHEGLAKSSRLTLISFLPSRDLPRKIWLVMTPELPRAPIKRPLLKALAIKNVLVFVLNFFGAAK
jgi:hypothetical protein